MSTAVVPRPRSAAEILDASVRLVRQHYWTLVALTALFYVPVSTFAMVAFPAIMPFEGATRPAGASSTAPLAWAVLSIVWRFATLSVALNLAAADAYSGVDLEARSILARMVRRSAAAVGLTVVGMALFAVAAILCAIPTLVPASLVLRFAIGMGSRFAVFVVGFLLFAAALLYSLSPLATSLPILVLERRDPISSLRRSAYLTQGLRAHVVRVFGLVLLVYFGLYVAVGICFRLIGYPILTRIVLIVVVVAVAPFTHVAATLLYYDLRVRKEGYDIDVMAEALESSVTPQVA